MASAAGNGKSTLINTLASLTWRTHKETMVAHGHSDHVTLRTEYVKDWNFGFMDTPGFSDVCFCFGNYPCTQFRVSSITCYGHELWRRTAAVRGAITKLYTVSRKVTRKRGRQLTTRRFH
jgi:hypothetical protein